MRNALFCAVAATFIVVGPSLAQADGPRDAKIHDADVAEVERLDRLVSTATSPEDGLSVYAPNVLQDDFFPPQRHGLAEVRQDFAAYMEAYSTFHADILDMTVDVDGALGVAVSHQHFTAKGHNGTPDLDAVVRQIDVYHKVDGRWGITYQQLSTPIDLKTGHAVWK
jgi:ketosteroid isomerase-like protein